MATCFLLVNRLGFLLLCVLNLWHEWNNALLLRIWWIRSSLSQMSSLTLATPTCVCRPFKSSQVKFSVDCTVHVSDLNNLREGGHCTMQFPPSSSFGTLLYCKLCLVISSSLALSRWHFKAWLLSIPNEFGEGRMTFLPVASRGRQRTHRSDEVDWVSTKSWTFGKCLILTMMFSRLGICLHLNIDFDELTF